MQIINEPITGKNTEFFCCCTKKNDPALPTLLERILANMYLLYREMRKGKKTGVEEGDGLVLSKMTAKKSKHRKTLYSLYENISEKCITTVNQSVLLSYML
jgi:hypothetical protein